MTDTLSPTSLPQASGRPGLFFEIVKTIGAYLGVAVLAGALMVLTVPVLRDQAVRLHSALVDAVAPDGIETALPAIGSGGLVPELRSIDIDKVPGRALSEIEPYAKNRLPTPIERTSAVGLLGNIPLPKIEGAMQQFDISAEQVKALEHYISRKYRVAKQVVDRLVESVLVAGNDLNVNPVLILAVMSVESRFNPYAESSVGAQGLMQVMTRVHTDKFEKLDRPPTAAFNPEVNIRIGVQILSDCIRRRGSEVGGLKCYVGATTSDDGGYSQKVQAERRRMALAAKIPLN
jgi:hypothetical protein